MEDYQLCGGLGGYYLGDTSGASGTLGLGGEGAPNISGGGGGGGYYGGGGGFYGGGGGGSSFTDSTLTFNTIHTQGFQNGDGYVLISWNAPLCYSLTRTSISVTVQSLPAPDSLSATPSTITCGGNTQISAKSQGNIIRWWDSVAGKLFGFIPQWRLFHSESSNNDNLLCRSI